MDFQPGTALTPATDERIQWFEAAYRVKLPAAYVAVLKDGNGAVPVRRSFAQGKRERMIERMLCLLPKPSEDNVNGWYDLSVVLSQAEARLVDDQDLVGTNVVPFAALFAGDLLCLDYRRNPEAPSIAVWDHEQSDEFQPVLDTVAPTFAAFEAMLV